jgi:hypothetical protein
VHKGNGPPEYDDESRQDTRRAFHDKQSWFGKLLNHVLPEPTVPDLPPSGSEWWDNLPAAKYRRSELYQPESPWQPVKPAARSKGCL